jgi:hypothetical protein
MNGRTSSSVQHPPAAECQACHWRDSARGALGRAAQHHDRTGHVVRVVLARVVTYGDVELERIDGQEAMTIPDDEEPARLC